jgi:catechol 2,3-dioxygenase-like lactoylglutathione lyase family enzyme
MRWRLVVVSDESDARAAAGDQTGLGGASLGCCGEGTGVVGGGTGTGLGCSFIQPGTTEAAIGCMKMLDHTGFVVSDLAKARRFYDAVAKALGLGTIDIGEQAFLLGRSAEQPIPYLWIGTLRPSYWAEGSRPGLNQTHVAFTASSRAVVDEFYRAALAAGGRDNGKPGMRRGGDTYYGAFVLDPDGNNIEACYRGEAAK